MPRTIEDSSNRTSIGSRNFRHWPKVQLGHKSQKTDAARFCSVPLALLLEDHMCAWAGEIWCLCHWCQLNFQIMLKFGPWPVSLFSSGMYFCNKSGTSFTCPCYISNKKNCRVEGFMQFSHSKSCDCPTLPSKPAGVVCPASRGKSSSLKDNFFMLIIERCPERWETRGSNEVSIASN